MSRIVLICIAMSALAQTGCPSDDLACVEVDPTCSPLYEPTFDNVFNNTLVPTCAPEGGACHAPDGNKGGISYTDVDSAYLILLGEPDGQPFVIPGDPSCSIVSKRINASRAVDLMPPGDPLSEAERCAIELWIANGAQR